MISVHLGGDASCTTICDPGQTLVELILDRTWQYLRYLLISWELLLYKTEGARKSFGDVIADVTIAQPLLWKNVPPPKDSCLSFSMSVPADTYDGGYLLKMDGVHSSLQRDLFHDRQAFTINMGKSSVEDLRCDSTTYDEDLHTTAYTKCQW